MSVPNDRQDPTPHCGEDGTPGVTRENCPWHPAEPTNELREALAVLLAHERAGKLSAWGLADALLSGPLAPLLAKVRAAEALIAFYDRHEYTTLVVDDLRDALAGER